MGRCTQASQVPENHHRPVNPHPQVLTEHGAEFETDLFTCVIKMATTSPIVHSLMQNVPPTSPNIVLFTFPPGLKHLSLTPTLGFPGWRQNSSYAPSSSADKGDLASSASSLSSLCRGRRGMHSSVCLRPFHEIHGPRARPNLQAGSRGSIFSDSSYSVSSSMMRALSSKY